MVNHVKPGITIHEEDGGVDATEFETQQYLCPEFHASIDKAISRQVETA